MNGSGATNLVGTISNISFMRPATFGGGPTPFFIVYFLPLCGDYIQMSLFFKTPKWESQNWDFCCPRTLDAHIFLKSSLFWKWNKISYRHQKVLFNGVSHAPIGTHLTPAFKGFVVKNQIPNLSLIAFLKS